MIERCGFQAYNLEIKCWCATCRSEVGQENSGLSGNSRYMLWLGREGTCLFTRSDLKDGLASPEYCIGTYCCHVTFFQLTPPPPPLEPLLHQAQGKVAPTSTKKIQDRLQKYEFGASDSGDEDEPSGLSPRV